MKENKNTNLVDDCYAWDKMDGRDDLEKMVNGFLTGRFICRRQVPADECLSEARTIIMMVRQHDAEDDK